MLADFLILIPGSPGGLPSSLSPDQLLPAAPGDHCEHEIALPGGNDLSQRRALLILPPPGRRLPEAALEHDLPAEVEAGLAFQLLDPSGTLWSSREPRAHPLWRGADLPDSEAEAHVSCEINPYPPQEAHVPWAVGLVSQKDCPRSLEGRWVITTIQNPEVDFGVSSILHGEAPLSGKQETSSVSTATAVLSVFTRTPHLQSRLGQDVLLDCSFSAPAVAFSVEWRHQYSGAGRVILAYDGAAQRMSVSEEGARLFLDPVSSNISLQLQAVQVHHEGIYICSIYLPHLHAQQAVELKIVEPPKATLRPVPFSVPPGTHAELVCEITGYYPQSVSVVWKRRSPGMAHEVLLDTWESGHRQSPDGTYSFTSFARLPAVQPGDQGSSYSCHMTHVGLGEAGLQKAVKLHVAGSSGPSVEDVIGLFLIAFALLGFLQAISRRESGVSRSVDSVLLGRAAPFGSSRKGRRGNLKEASGVLWGIFIGNLGRGVLKSLGMLVCPSQIKQAGNPLPFPPHPFGEMGRSARLPPGPFGWVGRGLPSLFPRGLLSQQAHVFPFGSCASSPKILALVALKVMEPAWSALGTQT
ncbi:tapasin [Python bivittatus]|uniref:Tapasin n=1 Tax=Python bivittatus TaxID=176946 RepID=A0A9F3QTV6_PYTBI|nr:tapasin [Python bivittatus]